MAQLRDQDRLLAEVRLASTPGIGGACRRELLAALGSAGEVFNAAADRLAAVPGIGTKRAAALAAMARDPLPARILDACRRDGVGIVTDGDVDYPALLSKIDDPPGVLFVRGGLLPCDGLAVAVVGSRHASAYGRRVAWQLAGSLARAGYTVISGLARGIDAAAHRGAIDAGGRTIAVLGTGVLNVYPPEHAELALDVVGHGALVSEVPPLAPATAGAFPRRNRLVSGLALGTIVVEAADRSGALITARLAAEQGREVFAVPGPIDSRVSAGCHRLIRDGARLVTHVDDVLEELGPLFAPVTAADGRTVRSPAELRLGDVERRVLCAVDDLAEGGSAAIDDIVEASGLAASQVLSTIGVLETRRLVRRSPGNRVARP